MKSKLSLLLVLLLVLSVFAFADTHDDVNDEHDEADEYDDEKDKDFDDEKDDDDDSDKGIELTLSESDAIAKALAELSEYANLTVDDISIEDNGYEIEFVSAIYEIEVFVDANRVVNIEKIEEEDEKKDEEESYDEDDSDVYTKNPSVLIMDAITQIQQLVEGNIIEIKLKSSDDNLYWDARTNLKERIEIDATSGSVKEFKSKVNGTEVEFKSDDEESEIKVKSGDDEFEAKGSNGFFARLFSFFN